MILKMHSGNSFYYAMVYIVKAANKRLLKRVGFAIRMPNYFPPGNGLLPRRLNTAAHQWIPAENKA
jgi:2-hydroxychromene-2-carboxylate isomerase